MSTGPTPRHADRAKTFCKHGQRILITVGPDRMLLEQPTRLQPASADRFIRSAGTHRTWFVPHLLAAAFRTDRGLQTVSVIVTDLYERSNHISRVRLRKHTLSVQFWLHARVARIAPSGPYRRPLVSAYAQDYGPAPAPLTGVRRTPRYA